MADTSNSPSREPRTGWRLLARWQLLIIVAALILFAGWRAGTFDRMLSNVGLQAHECARNGLGATFCGKELDEYRTRVSRAKQAGEEAVQRLKESQARANAQSQAEEAKGEEERKATAERHRQDLESKMSKEKAIVEREPEGSAASDLAHMEYESDRAQIQQLGIR